MTTGAMNIQEKVANAVEDIDPITAWGLRNIDQPVTQAVRDLFPKDPEPVARTPEAPHLPGFGSKRSARAGGAGTGLVNGTLLGGRKKTSGSGRTLIGGG